MPSKHCGDCSTKLGMFKRKVQCSLCRKHYCTPCFSKVKQHEVALQYKLLKMIGNNCLSCVVLNESIKREQLYLLGIKQLTRYLNIKNISTVHCNEKYHLVDLIMEYATANGFVCGSEVEKVEQHDIEIARLRQDEFLRQEQERARSNLDNDIDDIENITETARPSSSFIHVSEADISENIDNENEASSTTTPEDILATSSVETIESPEEEMDAANESQENPTVGTTPDVLINMSSDEEQENTIPQTRHGYSSQYLFSPSPSSVQPSKNIDKNKSRKWKSIEDIKRESEIAVLTVMELKQILTANFIGYKGCCEKKELIDKVKMLYSSEKKNESTENDTASSSSNYDKDICKICMDSVINCVLLDCGHLVACTKCGKRLAECPVCRALVVRVVHIFRV